MSFPAYAMKDTNEIPRQARRIEELLAKLDASADPLMVATARELVEALMDLHGAALERMLEIAAVSGTAASNIAERFGRDDLVGSLLVLYGLHPADFETRVRQALEKLEPRMRKHGHEIELLSAESGAVVLRVRAGALGHGSTAASLKASVEEAIYAAAPDTEHLAIEGLEETESRGGFVPLSLLTEMKGAV